MIDERDTEIENLKFTIIEVEKKNHLLNDKINEIIYHKAAAYKEKTLEAL